VEWHLRAGGDTQGDRGTARTRDPRSAGPAGCQSQVRRDRLRR
jgi:hypothetical protein